MVDTLKFAISVEEIFAICRTEYHLNIFLASFLLL